MKINTKLSIAALALFMSLASYAPVNAQENGAAEAVTTAETASKWQNIDGNWYYIVDGVKQTGWVGSDAWYFMNEDGVMQTGWVAVDGLWYHLDQNGRMQTGWVAVDGAWYYMNHSGGAMATGWVEVDGLWYFMNHNGGAMLTGWLNLEDTWYFLNHKGGAIVTGWFELDGNKYHFDGNGSMETGWLEVDGKTYFLQEDGVMATNVRIDDMEIGEDGVAVKVNVKVLLAEAIEAAEALNSNRGDYTAKSLVDFDSALSNANSVAKDKKATDLQAAAALERLENATENLVAEKATAEKVALFKALQDERAKDLKEARHTKESWAAYQAILTDAQKVLDSNASLISEVVTATTAVKESSDVLVLVETDREAQLKAIDEAKTLDNDGVLVGTEMVKDYTDISWKIYQALLDAVPVVNEKSSDADVLAAFKAVEAAKAELKAEKINATVQKDLFAALQKEVDAERKESDYTKSTWKVYAEDLAVAKEANANIYNGKVLNSEVMEATAKLTDSQSKLVNISALALAVKEAETNYKEEAYTEASWSSFEDTLKASKKVLADDKATQTEVNDAEKALAKAMKDLKPIVEVKVDKKELQAEYDAYKEGKYTTSTWEVFTEVDSAYDKAGKVLKDAKATQENVNALLGTIDSSSTVLSERGDTTVLKEYIKLAKLVNETEDAVDGDADFSLLEGALERAEKVIANDNTGAGKVAEDSTSTELQGEETLLKDAIKLFTGVEPVLPGA